MTERYGPEDASVPSWEPPSGVVQPGQPQYSPAAPNYPPPSAAGSAPGAVPQGVPTFRSWQPGFMPLRPLSLGDFLNLPMKALNANRAVILGGPLLCTIVTMLTWGVALALLVVDERDWFLYPSLGYSPLRGETILALVVAFLITLFTDAAARALVVPGVSRGILGERITLGKAWSITYPRIPQMLLFYLLIALIGIGVGLAFWALSATGAVALVGLLVFACIPGVLLAIVFVGVAVSAIVLERISATASFGRAFTLMKGSSWRLIGNFFVIYLVVWMIAGAINGVPQAILTTVAGSSPSLGPLVGVTIAFVVISTVVQSVVQYSFLGSLFTLMYVDLRIRTEGFDIDLARAAEAAARR